MEIKRVLTRKSILLLAFLSMLIACTNEQELMIPSVENAEETSSIRSLEEARQVALSGIKMIQQDEAKNETRASDRPERKLTEPIVKTRPSTRADGDTDTLMYVFNFADDQGYAIVDARVQNPGLIAVTEKGHYTENIQGLSDEDPQILIHTLVNNYIHKEAEDSVPLRKPKLQRIVSDTIISNITPRVTVRWGQDAPFNYFTSPSASAGCAIIAMLQVMSYFEHPSGSMPLTYNNHDVDSVYLDWVTFKNHHVSHIIEPLCIVSTAKHYDMGRLSRQMGQLASTVYTMENGGSTTATNMRSCMVGLGYTCSSWSDFTTGTMYNTLYNNMLVLMAGSSQKQNRGLVSHAWVVDGARLLNITDRFYEGYVGEPMLLVDEVTRTENYNHVNWGWNGSFNGYFLDGVFDPDDAKWYDSPTTGSLYMNFNLNLQIMTINH